MSNPHMPTKDGFWRIYNVSIETEVRQGAAKKYINEYLQAIGFLQTQISPTMMFERGSSLAGVYNFNPKSQKTEIHIDFATADGKTIVEVMMRVNCLGNRPLSKDYEFWAAELAGIEDVLENGYVNPYVSAFAAERALWYNVSVMLIVLMLTLSLTVTAILVWLMMSVPNTYSYTLLLF